MKTLLLGASGVIGQAIKNKLSQKGYEVIAPSRLEINLKHLDEINGWINKNNKFQVIIYCAGFNKPEYIEDVDLDNFKTTQNVNINSFYKIIQLLMSDLKQFDKSYVLGISSLFGTVSKEKRSAYAMSKHSMNGFIQTLALEGGKYNIIANTLSPGFIDTKMTRQNNNEIDIELLKSKIPLGRLGTPEDIANLAYFLCSEQNTYITGQNIICDGGISAGGII